MSGLELSFQIELVFAFVRRYGDEKLHAAQLPFCVCVCACVCLGRLPFVVLGLILYELEIKLICGGKQSLCLPCNMIDIGVQRIGKYPPGSLLEWNLVMVKCPPFPSFHIISVFFLSLDILFHPSVHLFPPLTL